MKKYDKAFTFANDIHDLIGSHAGKLPGDWAELEQWQVEESGTAKWTEKGTSSRVLLLRPPFEKIDNVLQYVRVIDPDLKKMEDYINLRIDAAVTKS